MNFDQALDYLLRLGHETLAMKFGLENTQRLLEAMGHPERTYPKVQIAGTNGKGSTAVMLDSICRAAGIRTGLYTSPHLQRITERIRIDGREITKERFAQLSTRVAETAQRLVETGTIATLPTFFEHVTVIALTAFRDENVELSILETGLGGRLDSTTAACAEVVAITSIALDHQEYLGETLAEIAAEKGAVIRPGVTAIVAPQTPAALEVILDQCAACHLEPILVGSGIKIIDHDPFGRFCATFTTSEGEYEGVKVNLPGRHQLTNAAVAIEIAEALITLGFDIPREAIIEGLENAEHPGRLEWHPGSPAFLFDGAHNAEGAKALREFLDECVDVPITLVFGAMQDKDLSEMAAVLFPAAVRVILTEINNPRSATREDLTRLSSSHYFAGQPSICDSISKALSAAFEQTLPSGLICVTGSLYLVGELKDLLQRERHTTYTA